MDETRAVLRNRVALVTGATGGLGRAIAMELGRQGCSVFITGRDRSKLESVGAELQSLGVTVYSETADLSRAEEVDTLCRTVTRCVGTVDVLVNSAGLFPVAALTDCSLQAFDDCFAVNVRAPFLLAQRLEPAMAEKGWGRIVNIGSSSAYAGFADTAVYCASKHALLGLSRSLREELKGHGVRVFCLSPGSIQTEMGRKVVGQTFETFIHPDEIARYLAFVISFDGEMISDEVRLNRVTIR